MQFLFSHEQLMLIISVCCFFFPLLVLGYYGAARSTSAWTRGVVAAVAPPRAAMLCLTIVATATYLAEAMTLAMSPPGPNARYFYAFESLCVWALLSLSLTDTHPAPALPPLSGSSLVAFLTEAMLAGLTTASHRPTTAADFVSLGLTTARLLIFLSLPALGFFYQGTTNTGDEESQALIGPLEAASSDYGSIYRQEIVLAQEEGRNFMDFVQTLVAEDSEEDSEEDSLV